MLFMIFTGLVTDRSKMYTHFENLTLMENTNADFNCKLKTETKDMFRIEVKICEAGSFYPVCVCRWFSNGSKCLNVRNILKCEADNTEMRISIYVRRNFTDVVWDLLEQNSSLDLLKHTQLQVTCTFIFGCSIVYDIYLSSDRWKGKWWLYCKKEYYEKMMSLLLAKIILGKMM